LFREYTDSSYKTLSARPDYFGNLGPLISAEVGDVVHVELKVCMQRLKSATGVVDSAVVINVSTRGGKRRTMQAV
jgi:hypothetical protein